MRALLTKLTLAFFVSLLAIEARSQEQVPVDLSSLQGVRARGALLPEIGAITPLAIGMTLEEVRTSLTNDNYAIMDQRLVTVSLPFKPNGVSVTAYSEKFIGRIIATKQSAAEKEVVAIFLTSPLTRQQAYFIFKEISYTGQPLKLDDVLPAMAAKWGKPSLNIRRSAVRYLAWYRNNGGLLDQSSTTCDEFRDVPNGIRQHYNMSHFYDFEGSDKYFKKGCGGLIYSQLSQPLNEKSEDVNGFDVTIFDNAMRRDDLLQVYAALKNAVDARSFQKAQPQKPKF